MSRARRVRAWVVCALLLLAASRLLVPAGPVAVPGNPETPLWSGAVHVHTTRSDGSGTPAEVAAAAAAAGLDFVILTDHGDGTREPSAPAYVSGVLVIDGVEVSTRDGHYLALGMPQAPYRLAGDGADVAEDVARLGGVGIIAHPDSARSGLAWHADDVRGDGLEILNADSAWRDDNLVVLPLRFIPYPWRPASVLATTLSYPDGLLARLDTPDADAPRLAVAGVDAHARIGLRPREEPLQGARTLARWPGYRASFGTFGLVVPWTRGRAPTGDASRDADAVVAALKEHRAHVATFALGGPAHVPFTALVDGAAYLPGARLDGSRPITLVVEAPPFADARVRLLRNGRPWREGGPGDRLVAGVVGGEPAVYRAEVWLPRRWRQPSLPWLVSQAIGVDLPDRQPSREGAAAPEAGDEAGVRLRGPWQTEHDPCSSIEVGADDAGAVAVSATLCDGAHASPFAAARIDWPAGIPAPAVVAFTGRADHPMRVSVQVREPGEGDGRRWARSVYLDTTARTVTLPLTTFRAVEPATGAPPVDRLHAILFVVDTVNTPRGTARTFRLEGLQLR